MHGGAPAYDWWPVLVGRLLCCAGRWARFYEPDQARRNHAPLRRTWKKQVFLFFVWFTFLSEKLIGDFVYIFRALAFRGCLVIVAAAALLPADVVGPDFVTVNKSLTTLFGVCLCPLYF